ncbi:MAG: dihydrofolate reductase [Rickettsiales bacterium]|jgi:dihydrofolate reductase|nr:dihydrofolate reductase [Rickettsiales bacterium]
MIVSVIAAIGKSNQLGLNNRLPWSLKDDLKNFKKLTLNHAVLMGRKTFESIRSPLPQRTNIVITKNSNLETDGIYVHDSIEKGIEFARNAEEEELFIIGGGKIYSYCLNNKLVHKIYLTVVDYDGVADTFFPKINMEEWEAKETKNFRKSNNNEFDFSFHIFERRIAEFTY